MKMAYAAWTKGTPPGMLGAAHDLETVDHEADLGV
jgi:hypothetical protein